MVWWTILLKIILPRMIYPFDNRYSIAAAAKTISSIADILKKNILVFGSDEDKPDSSMTYGVALTWPRVIWSGCQRASKHSKCGLCQKGKKPCNPVPRELLGQLEELQRQARKNSRNEESVLNGIIWRIYNRAEAIFQASTKETQGYLRTAEWWYLLNGSLQPTLTNVATPHGHTRFHAPFTRQYNKLPARLFTHREILAYHTLSPTIYHCSEPVNRLHWIYSNPWFWISLWARGYI